MDITELSPIFNRLPKKPNSCRIAPDFGDDEIDFEIFFEMLLNIYMEMIIDAERFIDMLYTRKNIEKKEVDTIDLSKINYDVLTIIEPWFKSLGFTINVHEYNFEDYTNMRDMLNIYCRLIFRDYDTGYFIMNKIKKLYHFVKFSNYKKSNDLKDICFVISYLDKYFVISFNTL